MPFENLPSIIEDRLDGNIVITPVNDDPIVLVLGTASRGPSETITRVDRVSDAARTFGKDGTLTRGMYEASLSGARNIRLYRVGATSASLIDIGDSPGYEVETVSKDDSAGYDYGIFWDASTLRLRVYRMSDFTVVWDNNPAYPLESIDLGEVSVSGSVTTSSTDIGTADLPMSLYEANSNGDGPAVFTHGTDGLSLSRMKTFEALYNAYQLLEDQEVDVVVPMDVYLDDKNVLDLTDAQRTALGLASLAAYPTGGDADDVLGKVFVQEYQGQNYFWWWFPSDIDASNMNTVFTTDSGANIFPSVGSASATLDADGDTLTGDDFHEVNFAWQLANFCFTQSRDNVEMTGVIGVRPPVSYSAKDISVWVGTLPAVDLDASGNTVITTNGTGLLGNKFMSGRKAAGDLPGYTVDGVSGLFNGGFIAVDDDSFLDGTQIEDSNEHLVDIGGYISIVGAQPILSNPSRTDAYITTGAATYGGLYSVLPVKSAPTNKLLRGVRLPFRLNKTKLDLLSGQRYVMFHQKDRGFVVTDSPTAARPDSDYQRLSTVRQVKAAMDAIRAVAEPFLGEGMDGVTIAALDTAIDGALKARVKARELSNYQYQLTSTQAQRVLGQATVTLRLVPAFELRRITVQVALAAA